MMAKRKTVLKNFTYMRCDDFAKYLSDMAAKGWHFKEWSVGLKFEKGEPEQAVYAVEVFQKASENDMRPGPNAQEFAEYCEEAGWKFLDAKQKYCIFKKIDENAVELFTPEERVTNAFKGQVSGSYLLLLFLYGLNAGLQWERLYSSFETVVFSGAFLFCLAIWNVLFLGQLIAIAHAFWMKARLRREIRLGNNIYIGNKKDGLFRFGWNDVYIGVLMLLLMYHFFVLDRIGLIVINAVIIGGTFGFAILLNRLRPERDASVLMQIGFTFMILFTLIMSAFLSFSGDGADGEMQKDRLPLVIGDYRGSDEAVQDISYYHEENIFGEANRYFVYGDRESIYYHIYQSSNARILDRVWDGIISGRKYNEGAVDCTGDWDAQKAIRNKIGTYYVRYERAVLEFRDREDVYLTEAQIDIILDKLGLR